MQWSQLKGRKVVSTATADRVGKVNGFVLDPKTRTVVGDRLLGVGSYAVVVRSD